MNNGVINILRKIIPCFLFNWYHWLLSLLGAFFYRFPSKRIKIIGVAGTDGKSTTVDLIAKILEQAKHKVASISSIKFKIGDKQSPNVLKMTMPGRFKIQRFLRKAINAKCQYVVLEVTDEGVKQHRHRFINFETAVLTNLTPEHIEAHGSFKKMRAMNGKFFQAVKKSHIINLDDENAEYFLQFIATQKIGYQISGELASGRVAGNSDFQTIIAQNFQISGQGISFFINNTKFDLKLFGKFNIYNSLAAISVGLSQGISLEICKKALEKVERISGRMEIIIKEPFKVIIDYAHTVNALKSVYKTIQESGIKKPEAKMICLLGACGGGRDKWKRLEFGKIAAKYCNQIILTNEDPYNENPLKIIEDIERGLSQFSISNFQFSNYKKILDRREAIQKALKMAKAGDVVIITGKGCEPWMCLANNKKIPWDEAEIVKQEFRRM